MSEHRHVVLTVYCFYKLRNQNKMMLLSFVAAVSNDR